MKKIPKVRALYQEAIKILGNKERKRRVVIVDRFISNLIRMQLNIDFVSGITFISRFALLGNKYGEPQAKVENLFRCILDDYPARTDIWSCYVDMLVKSNLIDTARYMEQY